MEPLSLSGLIGTTHTVTGLSPETSYSFTVSASDSVGESAQSLPATETTLAAGGDSPGFPARVFAPYIDMLLWPTPSLSARFSPDGARFFSAGFIVAGSGCQATWGRHHPMSEGFLVDDIAALRRLGGDVIVSFGGAAGTELALACATDEALEAEDRSVIDTYGLRASISTSRAPRSRTPRPTNGAHARSRRSRQRPARPRGRSPCS